MISTLRGAVTNKTTDSVVIDVGGVGFSVAVTTQTATTLPVGSEALLYTSLIVREDALSLYGFPEPEAMAVFNQLVSVTGVGPKSALGLLSALTVPQIVDAVSGDDDAPFRRVSGIGPKTAKLIVVQLAGKLAPARSGAAAATGTDIPSQVRQALIGLGWSERVAQDAVTQVAEAATESERSSVRALLKHALAHLGPAQKGTAE